MIGCENKEAFHMILAPGNVLSSKMLAVPSANIVQFGVTALHRNFPSLVLKSQLANVHTHLKAAVRMLYMN